MNENHVSPEFLQPMNLTLRVWELKQRGDPARGPGRGTLKGYDCASENGVSP